MVTLQQLAKDQVKVEVADYELLRKDFPCLKGRTQATINEWLVEEVGWMRESQLSAEDPLLSPVPKLTGKIKEAWQPPKYGRAVVQECQCGVLDVKGGGTTTPTKDIHGTGYMSVDDALSEYYSGRLISGVLNCSGVVEKPIEAYAVVSLGVKGSWWPEALGKPENEGLALLVRRAHVRHPGSVIPPYGIELVLRPFGLRLSADLFAIEYGFNETSTNIPLIGDTQASDKYEPIDFATLNLINPNSQEEITRSVIEAGAILSCIGTAAVFFFLFFYILYLLFYNFLFY